MAEHIPKRFFDRRATIVAAGSVAAGLAAFAAYEVHSRKKSRPESLLDERVATYRRGAIQKVTAALLGGPMIMGRQRIETQTELSSRHAGDGLNYLTQQGLVVGESFTNPQGNRELFYLLGQALPRAIVANPDAYEPLLEATTQYYPEFSLGELKQRFNITDNS